MFFNSAYNFSVINFILTVLISDDDSTENRNQLICSLTSNIGHFQIDFPLDFLRLQRVDMSWTIHVVCIWYMFTSRIHIDTNNSRWCSYLFTLKLIRKKTNNILSC